MSAIKTKLIGVLIALSCVLSIVIADIPDISKSGKTCLLLTLTAVIFWIFKVADTSFIAGAYLVLLLILKAGSTADVFYAWTDGISWLVIGSFLITHAVVSSGICRRLTYLFVLRFVCSFRSLVISIFVLSTALALIIPNPWPRCLILIATVKEIANAANLSRRDRATVGFSVFAASIPSCFIFQTGAAAMNQLVLSFADISLSWLEWFKLMGVPGICITVLYCLLFLILFPSKEPFLIDYTALQQVLSDMGKISKKEIRIIIWLGIAVIVWLTDEIHGIKSAWSTFGLAMLMAFPGIGGVIQKESWKEIPVDTLVYQTAAVAIGRVGTQTGMTAWITRHFLPSSFPNNLFISVLIIAVTCMALHVFLGSTIAANSILIPAFLLCSTTLPIPPVICVLICYTAIFSQFIFPYQHINILMGIGTLGMYEDRICYRLALPLTFLIPLVIAFIEIPWWIFLGVL